MNNTEILTALATANRTRRTQVHKADKKLLTPFDAILDTALVLYEDDVDVLVRSIRMLKGQYTEEDFTYLIAKYILDLYTSMKSKQKI